MRIYFLGMPFFMLYNYGAAILRAVGDTKRPLLFLIISGVTNAGAEPDSGDRFHLGVAGVAIATVISQLISCILVLRCLYHDREQLSAAFFEIVDKLDYLKQIFQVGIPAGIQSTVINFSNALLQSSVNSFGSVQWQDIRQQIIFWISICVCKCSHPGLYELYQSELWCGKYKRMDRVLLDCMILSFVVSFAMGCGYLLVAAAPEDLYGRP